MAALMLLIIAFYSIYNKFHKRVHTPPEINYARNMQFLQNLIDFIAIVKKTADV